MTRLKRLYLDGKLLDVTHPFEEEVDCLVRTNHTFVMTNISRLEKENIAMREKATDCPELGSDLAETRAIANDLRRAANALALVGLVTRLNHWVSIFVEEITNETAKNRGLVTNLKRLNDQTGSGPVSIEFFDNLVTVRDSIVHADSQIEWTHQGRKRQVSEQYANTTSGDIEFTETHLQEAMENSIKQVKWYDDRLDTLEAPKTD